MDKQVMLSLLKSKLHKSKSPLPDLNATDWKRLMDKFHCDFSDDFITFMELIGQFEFPGELLYVSGHSENIISVYDQEISYGRWHSEMIPFFGIGNGDYNCVNSYEGKHSAIYYVSHTDSSIEVDAQRFEQWLTDVLEERLVLS